MKTQVVLSGTGRDRVGVADDLTAALAKHGVRIENSRWTAMGGRFNMMVQLSGEHDDVEWLRSDLPTMRQNLGFELELSPVEPQGPPSKAAQFLIECFAKGPPDLNAVTGLLKEHGVNIDNLETEVGGALFSSRPTFAMTARVTMPPSAFERVQEKLRQLERERNLDVVIKPTRTRKSASKTKNGLSSAAGT